MRDKQLRKAKFFSAWLQWNGSPTHYTYIQKRRLVSDELIPISSRAPNLELRIMEERILGRNFNWLFPYSSRRNKLLDKQPPSSAFICDHAFYKKLIHSELLDSFPFELSFHGKEVKSQDETSLIRIIYMDHFMCISTCF